MTSYLSSLWTPFFGASQPSIQADGDAATTGEDGKRAAVEDKGHDEVREAPETGPSTFKVPDLPQRLLGGDRLAAPSAANSKSPPADHDDLDAPPMFPMPNSAQRSSAPPPSAQASSSRPAVPSFNLAPPSPTRDDEDAEPPSELNIAVTPGTIPLGNMAPPPSTTSKPDFGMAKDGSGPDGRRRRKVALGPGYSPLDWARLTQSGRNLRGVEGPMRVTVEELAKHNTFRDAWTALDGIVYNITPYLRFHPGGQKELLRAAGRDGTKLFMLTHSWVNYQFMLNECAIGPLVKG